MVGPDSPLLSWYGFPNRVPADLCHRGARLSCCVLVVGVVSQPAERIQSGDHAWGARAHSSGEPDQPSAAVAALRYDRTGQLIIAETRVAFLEGG
jgi:hypothetical protein